jgi:hypothetical protein
MPRVVFSLLILLSGASAGCSCTGNATGGWDFFSDSIRNVLTNETRYLDDIHFTLRNCWLAHEAWETVRKATPGHSFSCDYEAGFKAGFTDYLDAGGNGLPPSLPPPCYRHHCYQTPGGCRAVEAWYAGFRHGVAVARQSGLREASLLPVNFLSGSLARERAIILPPAGGSRPPAPPAPPAPPLSAPVPPARPEEGDLPPPRKAPRPS